MKVIIFLVLLFSSLHALAAAPSPVCTNSVSSGVAPLSVFRDCTGTTGVTMHTGLFMHNFGDTGAGNWTYGANAGQSKNFATGIVAAHVFETPGTYTVRTRVCNSSNECATDTDTVTVTAPDTVYASTATVCVNTSAPTAGADGCPSGAAVATASDFCSAVSSHIGTTKRVLFRRGVTFACAAKVTITADGPWTIGAYGAGTGRAIVSTAQSAGIVIEVGAGAGVFPNDGRIMDLEITQSTGTTTSSIKGVGNFDNLTMLNLYIHSIGDGPAFVINQIDISGNDHVWRDLTIANSVIENINGGGGAHGVYAFAERFALLGNLIDDTVDAEHLVRLDYLNKAVIQSNTLRNGPTSKEAIAIRGVQQDTLGTGYAQYVAPAPSPTQYVVVADNDIKVRDSQGLVYGPANDTIVVVIQDVLDERNWFRGNGEQDCSGIYCPQVAINTQAKRHTIRNNLVDCSLFRFCAIYGSRAASTGMAAADLHYVDNNTAYSSRANTNVAITSVQADSTNISIRNNLAYLPNASGTVYMVFCFPTGSAGDCAAITGLTTATNSSAAQITGTSPSFDGPLTEPKGFRISTLSYAASGGTAVFPASNDDFFHCDDATANEHMGAFVPRARATCRGAK